MASFDKYSNYKGNAGVSGVVFGANKTVLEVELNEVQDIQSNAMHNVLHKVVGDGITDLTKLTYDDGSINIGECSFIVDGTFINCTGLSIPATSGDTVYLQTWEETIDHLAELKEEGNQQSNVTIKNWARDDRSNVETSRRKVVKYDLSTQIDESKHNLAIASIVSGKIIKLICEINILKAIKANENVINVKMHGVVGDGMTDDTDAIQSLINSAKSGDVLYFPTGTYLISSGLIINHKQIVLRGDNPTNWGYKYYNWSDRTKDNYSASVIKLKDGISNVTMLTITGASTNSDVSIENVKFASSSATWSTLDNEVTDGTPHEVYNFTINDENVNGIHADTDALKNSQLTLINVTCNGFSGTACKLGRCGRTVGYVCLNSNIALETDVDNTIQYAYITMCNMGAKIGGNCVFIYDTWFDLIKTYGIYSENYVSGNIIANFDHIGYAGINVRALRHTNIMARINRCGGYYAGCKESDITDIDKACLIYAQSANGNIINITCDVDRNWDDEGESGIMMSSPYAIGGTYWSDNTISISGDNQYGSYKQVSAESGYSIYSWKDNAFVIAGKRKDMNSNGLFTKDDSVLPSKKYEHTFGGEIPDHCIGSFPREIELTISKETNFTKLIANDNSYLRGLNIKRSIDKDGINVRLRDNGLFVINGTASAQTVIPIYGSTVSNNANITLENDLKVRCSFGTYQISFKAITSDGDVAIGEEIKTLAAGTVIYGFAIVLAKATYTNKFLGVNMGDVFYTDISYTLINGSKYTTSIGSKITHESGKWMVDGNQLSLHQSNELNKFFSRLFSFQYPYMTSYYTAVSNIRMEYGSVMIDVGEKIGQINIMDNSIANCMIDGITDDYDALSKIMDYVNNTTHPITVVFPYTGFAMNISDTIRIKRSNVRFEIFCDIKFTKSTFETGVDMNVFDIGYSSISRKPIYGIDIVGHGIVIDANGASIGLEQTGHTQVAEGNGIIFRRVCDGTLEGVHVKNALCDGIKIYNSKNIIVDHCEVSGTCIDNGLTVMGLPLFTTDWVFDKYADRCRNNVIVRNCVSHNNEDVGFSASVCYGVTFENCLSYENGNIDGFNAGGAFSAEILGMEAYFEVSTDYDMDVKFIDCRALNNNNYAFYSDIQGVLIDGCYVDMVIQNNDSTYGRTIRGGNGFYNNGVKGNQTILNSTFKNCGNLAIMAINGGTSVATVLIDNVTMEDNKKGIYTNGITYLKIKNISGYRCPSPIYTSDGTGAKYIEVRNVSLIESGSLYIGNADMMIISDLYANVVSMSVAMNIAKVASGMIRGIIIDKAEGNTTWLTGVYIYDTCGETLKFDENSYLTTANIALTDKRVAEATE